ncbi:MAG: sel1 repeat family protein [Gammaproteobacteria bacterium]|nr:sel1 repeat family protein [Gammaproteobacteria bacterium]
MDIRPNSIFCLTILLLLNGCLYLPIPAPETQNVPAVTELEKSVGKPFYTVHEIVGEPVQVFVEDDKTHHYYLETQGFGELLVPYAVGGTLNEIYHCYQLTYDKSNKLQSVAVGDKGLRLYRSKTDCRESFWATKQIEFIDHHSTQIHEMLKANAKEGDRNTAFRLAYSFDDFAETVRLADYGDREASTILAKLFYDVGYERRYKRKLRRSKLISDAKYGDPKAQLSLYYTTVPSNLVSAYQWLCRSAGNGYPEAQYRLANIYEHGSDGREISYTKAYLWYMLSDKSGSKWGDDAQRIRNEYLDAQSLTAANKMLREWQPGQCEVDLSVKEIGEY